MLASLNLDFMIVTEIAKASKHQQEDLNVRAITGEFNVLTAVPRRPRHTERRPLLVNSPRWHRHL